MEVTALAEEIRSDAVHEGVDISTILRKCKVLAGEIESAELDQWSTWESLGYPTEQPVPHYRLLPLQLVGKFVGPFGLNKVAPVPLAYLPEYARNFRDVYECRESATLIEHSLAHAENGVATINTGALHLSVGRSLYRGYRCTSLRAEVSSARLTVAIHAIRDHILNLTNALLQQQREAYEAAGEDNYQDQRNNSTGLVVHRSRDAASQEDWELEQAWARVRHMNRPTE